jgi:hypothetical protein
MSHGLLRELAKRGHDVDMASLGFGSSAHDEDLTHRYSP